MAWMHFRRVECDIVVLETGMGGRLNSPMSLPPEVAVVERGWTQAGWGLTFGAS